MFTYIETLPTPKDRIRHRLGDTKDPGLRSDEMIEALVASDGESLATALLAEGLASEFAQRPNSLNTPDGLGLTWGERIKQWQKLADDIRSTLVSEAEVNSRLKLQTFSLQRADRHEETPEYRHWPLYFPGEPYG